MSTITADLHAHPHAEHGHAGRFLTTYVFSRDHKIIGIQFLFSTLIWFFIGRQAMLWSAGVVGIVGTILFYTTFAGVNDE